MRLEIIPVSNIPQIPHSINVRMIAGDQKMFGGRSSTGIIPNATFTKRGSWDVPGYLASR